MSVVVSSYNNMQSASPAVRTNKNVLRGLGIAETIIGMIFLCLQITSVSIVSADYGSSSNAIVVGFIAVGSMVVAGALGIASGSTQATPTVINWHMGFDIVAAIVSFAYVITGSYAMSVLKPVENVYQEFGVYVEDYNIILAITIPIVVLALVSGIMFIISATFCCKTTSSLGYDGCCGGCGEQRIMTHPVSVGQVQAGVGITYNGQPSLALSGVNYPQPGQVVPQYEQQKPDFEPLPNKLQ